MRGYFGIGIINPKNELNIGTLWRSAKLMDAAFIFTIGRRYRRQPSDVLQTPRHVPLFEYQTWQDFKNNGVPNGCQVIAIELDDRSTPLESMKHPQNAIYLLGAEDDGIPKPILQDCHRIIQLPGERSMNVAVAGSIVMYDRILKARHAISLINCCW